MDAPGSGAGPLQVESACAAPPGSINRPAAAPDCKICRLETSTNSSSLVHAGAAQLYRGHYTRFETLRQDVPANLFGAPCSPKDEGGASA